MATDRRYSDHDVALILKRAVELEDQRTPAPPSGISLSELQGIAREVGIDPGMVRSAAEELELQGRLDRGILKLPETSHSAARIRDLRAVPRRLEESELHRLLLLAERAYPEGRAAPEAPGSAGWVSVLPLREARITLWAREEDTLIAVEESHASARAPLLAVCALVTTSVGVGIGISEGGAGTVLMLALIFAIAGFFVGGGLWQLLLDRSAGRVRDLTLELAREAEMSGGTVDTIRSGPAS